MKRQTDPVEVKLVACLKKGLVDGTVVISKDCSSGLNINDLHEPGTEAIVCSSTCDSLYLAVVQCLGEADAHGIYSKECTNGYMGPKGG